MIRNIFDPQIGAFLDSPVKAQRHCIFFVLKVKNWLTPELKKSINEIKDLQTLDDIYLYLTYSLEQEQFILKFEEITSKIDPLIE